ncbi:hypothetical protein DM01DRAFT_1373344 [Hesseltinella vesiculosa]|uniref:Uncharacterized protein n=1 Tax=Hesseltinella vesiculosa TaxID=101127 RepID=A0A1X2GL48_9FUNG|nr:hypothetical protein DM01DRAFT_1373344 [Hesseltinella vesiculosa]
MAIDSPFFALVAVCICLLLLTFYLAVRRRRRFNRQQAQNQQTVQYDYSPNVIITIPSNHRPTMGTYPTSSYDRPPRPAVQKPETSLEPPPPSYQDYPEAIAQS